MTRSGFIVEATQPDGSWEAKCMAVNETCAQLRVTSGKVMRRIQGVAVGEWRVIYVPKEGWS